MARRSCCAAMRLAAPIFLSFSSPLLVCGGQSAPLRATNHHTGEMVTAFGRLDRAANVQCTSQQLMGSTSVWAMAQRIGDCFVRLVKRVCDPF